MSVEFRRVYDEHFAFVWRVLRRFGVADADIADVAQEVFIVVHRQLPKFEGRSKLTTWLFAISWRVYQDRRKKRAEEPMAEIELQALAPAVSSDDPVEAQQDAALLERVLAQIAEPFRTVFILFELEELEMLEIAELLTIPSGTVASRLRIARGHFAAAVKRIDAAEAQHA